MTPRGGSDDSDVPPTLVSSPEAESNEGDAQSDVATERELDSDEDWPPTSLGEEDEESDERTVEAEVLTPIEIPSSPICRLTQDTIASDIMEVALSDRAHNTVSVNTFSDLAQTVALSTASD